MVTKQEVRTVLGRLRRVGVLPSCLEDAAVSQILGGLYPICSLGLYFLLGIMDSVLMALYSTRLSHYQHGALPPPGPAWVRGEVVLALSWAVEDCWTSLTDLDGACIWGLQIAL